MLAAVLHRHRQRQRLAAGAGAPIGDAHAGPRHRPARRRAGCPRPGFRPARSGTPARSSPARRPAIRRPQGDSGVGSASMPSSASAACAASRVAFSRLARRSSGAGSASAAISARERRRRSGRAAAAAASPALPAAPPPASSGWSSVWPSRPRQRRALGGISGAGANWPPEKALRDPRQRPALEQQRGGDEQPRRAVAAPARSSHQASRRRSRSTRQARSETARRSPEPMKRRSRKKSLATASAGRCGRALDRGQQLDRGGDPGGGRHASAVGTAPDEVGAVPATLRAQAVFVRLAGAVDPERRGTRSTSAPNASHGLEETNAISLGGQRRTGCSPDDRRAGRACRRRPPPRSARASSSAPIPAASTASASMPARRWTGSRAGSPFACRRRSTAGTSG